MAPEPITCADTPAARLNSRDVRTQRRAVKSRNLLALGLCAGTFAARQMEELVVTGTPMVPPAVLTNQCLIVIGRSLHAKVALLRHRLVLGKTGQTSIAATPEAFACQMEHAAEALPAEMHVVQRGVVAAFGVMVLTANE